MARRDLASRLTGRVRIEASAKVDNGRGGRTLAPGQDPWRIVADRVAAEIIGLRGDEALQNAVLRSKQLWRVTIRARPGLKPTMQLAWHDPLLGDLIGNVRAITPNETGDALVMTVETGGAA